jgi:repressor LexA
MSFGQTLRNLRIRKKVTQTQMADELEVSRSAISLYELDLREPDIKFLQRAANYFEVSMDDLLGTSGKALGAKEFQNDLVFIPLVGKVPAGTPAIPAEDIEDYLPVPSSFAGKNQVVFALKIKGDSMIDSGINDGDIVLVRKQELAENGQTVVARINGEEVTCKRFYTVNNKVTLEPANRKYRALEPQDVEIVGVVFKVIKDIF